ncbi:contractile injection system protein, VgrG/Pvc8 family [Sphingomonas sp. AOB5]|uniref:phage baseplate assembly protein n=1 Tax=Sphingomonas sp. AOB5 TaxID=3034017 RepID=UPI0023F7FD5E|nr:contractile injection system protein, VgrG/Pvc8 family [Sphingomonas sp. AOB5]MDF7777838.1 contractile injection system protein, VgrG/Pvc8 family [Sphingomonas sp. AOB5]
MADLVALAKALEETVELRLGGAVYSAWDEVTVTRSMEGLSGSFSLVLAAQDMTDAAEFKIRKGQRCIVQIGGEIVINGWIDAVYPSISGEQHKIRVAGRDRTADLADCSAIHKPGSWINTKLEAIAAELVKPFGIKVTVTASGGTGAPIRKFAIQQGETVQSALERLLRFRGLLMVADGNGDLEIITPAEAAPIATLELGVNILEANGSFDDRERFSDYVVKGQASGGDDHNGAAVAQIRGTAKDAGVERYRPFLVIAEEQSDGASATVRAKFEAGVRAGRSVNGSIVVPGWRSTPGGPLWRPNVRVKVKCAPVQLPDEIMLVPAVTLTKGEKGTTATITVLPPEAWKQLAQPEARR